MTRSKFPLGLLTAGCSAFFVVSFLFIAWNQGWIFRDPVKHLETLIKESKWDDAEQAFKSLPDSIQSDIRLILLAKVRIGQGRPDGALNALEKLSKESRNRFEVKILKGRAFLLNGNAALALEQFELAQLEKPEDPESLRGLAGALYDLGSLDRAINLLSTFLKNHPDALSFRFAGQISKELGRSEEAGEYFNQALEAGLPPMLRGEVAMDLLDVQLDRNDTRQANQTWKTYLEEAPESAKKSALLGRLRMLEGKWEEAAPLLDQARKQDPASTLFARLRGQIWMEQGKPEEAVPLFEYATLEDPLDTIAWNQKSLALERLGRREAALTARKGLEEATANLNRMTELNEKANNFPGDVETRLELVKLCQKVNRQKLAEVWTRAAQEAARMPKSNPAVPPEQQGGPKP